MYNSDQTFGGISILLIGDFIQLPVTTGRDLWSVMYVTVSGNDGIARRLVFILCETYLTKNLAFWYKSYGFVDSIKFLRTK